MMEPLACLGMSMVWQQNCLRSNRLQCTFTASRTASISACLQDATKKFQPMRDAIDLCREVARFILWSPKRMQAFQHARKEFSEEGKHTNIRPLCPTRWTVREGAIAAILQNYEALQDTFATINSECHDDYRRTAGGLLAQMEKFNTYFGLKLSYLSLVPLNSCPALFKGKTLQLVKLCVPLSLSRLILNVSGVMNSSTASMPKPSQKLQSTQVNLGSQGTGAHQRNWMEVPSLTGTTVLKHTTATSTSRFWSWSVES